MDQQDRELLERLVATVERLEAVVGRLETAEEDRLARERNRSRRRRQTKGGPGFFDGRPGVESIRLVGPTAVADEPTAVADLPTAVAENDRGRDRGRTSSEPESGGTVVALDRSIDPIDLLIKKIDPEIDPEIATAVAASVRAGVIACRDGTRCTADLDRFREVHKGLDVTYCFVDISIRIALRPDLAPRTALSAPSWLNTAFERAARSAGVFSPPPETVRPPGKPDALESSPLARRLEQLNRKEGAL